MLVYQLPTTFVAAVCDTTTLSMSHSLRSWLPKHYKHSGMSGWKISTNHFELNEFGIELPTADVGT